ncbi:transposable element Tcb2 transposase [Trichonephila clavipes]|nr:transposable element Tcb2 transposase [Trichonephila clavipes]
MSERSRLPDSLRWRAVRWMEMALSQAYAARRLNVPLSVVHRDHFIALSVRRRRRISVPQLVADHSIASGRRISASTVWRRLHNSGLYARGPVISPDSQCRAIQDVCSFGRNESPYIINPTLLKDSYGGGGIMVWAGISLGGHTDPDVFQGGTLTGVRYQDEILDPYVRPYAGAIGNDFILMDDNARPHRAVIVEEYLEGLGLE